MIPHLLKFVNTSSSNDRVCIGRWQRLGRLATNPPHLKKCLRVLNYFSAPFGSEEYNFLAFGVEGIHHTLQPDGTQIFNDRGRAEINELGTVVTPTNTSTSLELSRLGIDLTTAIITGREPLTALDIDIKDWQSRGVDQILQELWAARQRW